MKVILHVDEKEKWDLALGNIVNLLKQKEDLIIELLVHGAPIVNLKENVSKDLGFYDEISELSNKGVVFAACNNSLNKMKINKDELCDFVKVVPAGVMELIKKQNEGYAYVKP
ncbi:DsrE family protein [Eubacterium multiforme]|uniref:Intracellular sulfur oxidation DsrE/DsrF family protein n=1 Tax=Eubacterium multiforme TaxID=83339 RepID=A0ABT9UWV0_9FIRM|nr:DsrE family protein [Eubacterium multiforme]MDQ0150799.1 intracellular sulfur oxidation DsrE/DsrF family protein [Eubacterium multiforme]